MVGLCLQIVAWTSKVIHFPKSFLTDLKLWVYCPPLFVCVHVCAYVLTFSQVSVFTEIMILAEINRI